MRSGVTNAKYHLRSGASTSASSTLFPWDDGGWQNQLSYTALADVDLSDLLPFRSRLWGQMSTVSYTANANLDPNRTWTWEGVPIKKFRSQVSFEREAAGVTSFISLTDWFDVLLGFSARRMVFDGDIETDVRTQAFNFTSLWFSPDIGLAARLPWGFESELLYSGFNRGELSFGNRVERPYVIVTSLSRSFGNWWMEVGYELDHVELDRATGSRHQHAHIRLKSAFWGVGFRF